MNSIKLTSIQKKKLLKMVGKLFPEYKYISEGEVYQSGNKYYETNDPNVSLYELTFIKEDGSFNSMHWFEFTYTILLDKLVKKLGYEGYQDYIGMNSYFPNFDGIYSIYKLTL